MSLYRAYFDDGKPCTFAATPRNALAVAAMLARWKDAELLELTEERPLAVNEQFSLRGI